MLVENRLWKVMLSKSRDPREWYQDSDSAQWTYRIGTDYEVGFYDAQGVWNQDSAWENAYDAWERVRWLNGG